MGTYEGEEGGHTSWPKTLTREFPMSPLDHGLELREPFLAPHPPPSKSGVPDSSSNVPEDNYIPSYLASASVLTSG